MSRRKLNKKRVSLIAIVLITVVVVLGIGFRGIINKVVITKHGSKVNTDTVEEKTEEPVQKSITISFAGDVTMGNYKGAPNYDSFDHEFERQGKDYSYFLGGVKSVFEKDDLTVVNLEGPLTTATEAKVKKFAFKGDPSYVNILKEGSVEAVNIANNHSEDYFEKGMQDTKFILDENKIDYFGLGEKAIIDVEGIKVGFLGYTGWPENYNEEYLKKMEEDIKELKKESDAVIAFFHWGIERQYTPNKVEKDFAHHAIDKGADLVVGSHHHVIQGIEKYNDKYIAYGLGNFCFGGNKNPSDKDSMIYQQTFTFTDNKLTKIDEPNVIPVSISSSSYRNNYRPTILDASERERVLNKLKKISEQIK